MSNDLTKYEIVKMAREAGFIIGRSVTTGEPNSPERFATLCRAPLVAEVERLKKMSVANIMVRVVPGYDGGGEEIYANSVEEVNAVMSDLSQRLDDVETERDDWKARALKAEQAVLVQLKATTTPEGWLNVSATPAQACLNPMAHWQFGTPEQDRQAIIADFLKRTGQYVTNEATRDAAIADAITSYKATSAVPVVRQMVDASTT